ncbi:NUDIX domain-containing protein [Rhizobium cremeum]|uniref:NUDIX domain-containing protein n=1 Tax=Rhizobium cremeum TaxID=2813827 RepID=UPI000DD93732|nr:NUDIX domain-containing protein [Rhizobium cremeum]MCJ7993547.1 NUDIX domain-containing protein [Rhizobium cremeum]MCJ7998604.1 NUDIX domain-containing protein [Rhizobium cremeum]
MTQQQGREEVSGPTTRFVLRILHSYFAISRGMTLGVRAACFDEEGRIFLVRHSYVPGWYMPGGGVERRETVMQALEKELREEGNLVMTEPPQIFHVYYNSTVSKRDHVLLYRAKVIQTAPRPADREIVESGFFDPRDLPPDTTTATRRRLAELGGEASPADIW